MFKKINLFSKTEMKLLVFLSQKTGEMYEREIAKEAKVSVGSVNTLLKNFVSLGLLRQQKKGRMLFYSRNDQSPLLRQFKVFICVNSLLPLIEKISPFSKRIILFGSCASGRNDQNSDIDLFILSDQRHSIKRIVDDYPQVQVIVLNLQEFIQLQKNDLPLFERINQGIELFGDANGPEI